MLDVEEVSYFFNCVFILFIIYKLYMNWLEIFGKYLKIYIVNENFI